MKEHKVSMKYRPLAAVWEVTNGCNMRCGHCGSSCAGALPDELTTDEAFSLIDDIVALKLKWITFSGGEPLTRKDLPKLIERLSAKGLFVNIITNGWLLDREIADTLKSSGISTVGVSVDGTEEIHDSIRKEGSYDRIRKTFEHLNGVGVNKSAITTVFKQNIGNLPELRDELLKMNVDSWQLQFGMPMGNLKEHGDWVIEPEQIEDIIDFCDETSLMDKIRICIADNLGYHTKKELQTQRRSFRSDRILGWNGCCAGLVSFGILHNGDIVGCTSIRDTEFIEGNIRDTRLAEIWHNPDSFAWRRKLTKNDLRGDCLSCKYADTCLGGCTSARLAVNGSIYSENGHCAYNCALKKLKR